MQNTRIVSVTDKIDSKGLAKKVRTDRESALVLFSGEWCKDCRAFKPVWDAWTEGRAGPIYTVEVGRAGREWKEWSLDEIPTVAAYSGGSEVGRAHGAITRDDLESLWKGKLSMA
jgi:thioredoxin-like negative regulator of GroEL